jgi:anthranilate synthase component 1
LHRAFPRRYPHFLQSAAHGRYDILFAHPGRSLTLDADGLLRTSGRSSSAPGDFLDAFDNWWRQYEIPAAGSTLPFTGGWFVYLGYELAAQVEPCLRLPAAWNGLPVAMATRFKTAIVHDQVSGSVRIVGEQGQAERMDRIAADIDAVSTMQSDARPDIRVAGISEEAARYYLDAIARIQGYIREGDVFQVNLSRPWQIKLKQPVAAADLYASLAVHNPAPFAGLASWPGASLVSSSPERLVAVRGGRVETRPIAGTRPRGAGLASDRAYSDELLAHPKERAEHIMLIDLERNDLGRLCVPGTIEVNELMVLESYAHVHHIVSNIRGQLRADITPGQVIQAVFPGGTITGCPKVRCMEIIAELEREARGAYTGSMGYINRDGSMDLNILIRSMVSTGRGICLRAGAGIVADSLATAELEETRAKARGLLRALGIENA